MAHIVNANQAKGLARGGVLPIADRVAMLDLEPPELVRILRDMEIWESFMDKFDMYELDGVYYHGGAPLDYLP